MGSCSICIGYAKYGKFCVWEIWIMVIIDLIIWKNPRNVKVFWRWESHLHVKMGGLNPPFPVEILINLMPTYDLWFMLFFFGHVNKCELDWIFRWPKTVRSSRSKWNINGLCLTVLLQKVQFEIESSHCRKKKKFIHSKSR